MDSIYFGVKPPLDGRWDWKLPGSASGDTVRPRHMILRWRLSHVRGYLALGMLREAEAELDAIAPDDAEQPEPRALRVALLHELEDWPRLRAFAQELVTREPNEAGWWVSLAFATRRCESLERARAILLQAEPGHPDEPIIQFNLGCYAAQLGALEEARARVLRSISLSENFREIARHDPDLAPLREKDPGFPGDARGIIA